MTDTNLYNAGYDVGFEDGFKEAQGQVKELEDKLAKAVEALAWCSIYEESEVATTTLAELKGESNE